MLRRLLRYWTPVTGSMLFSFSTGSLCTRSMFRPIPLQLLHVRAVLWENPDPPAKGRPSMQVKSYVIHLLRLAAGETRHLTGAWDCPQVVDPQEVARLVGQETESKVTSTSRRALILSSVG